MAVFLKYGSLAFLSKNSIFGHFVAKIVRYLDNRDQF